MWCPRSHVQLTLLQSQDRMAELSSLAWTAAHQLSRSRMRPASLRHFSYFGDFHFVTQSKGLKLEGEYWEGRERLMPTKRKGKFFEMCDQGVRRRSTPSWIHQNSFVSETRNHDHDQDLPDYSDQRPLIRIIW